MFGAENGFAFGIALWKPLDPSIGEMAIYSDEWGHRENGEDFWEVKRLETHICTNDELGIEGENKIPRNDARFMPVNKAYKGDFDSNKNTLICIDKTDSYMFGSYNSDEARVL